MLLTLKWLAGKVAVGVFRKHEQPLEVVINERQSVILDLVTWN